MTATILVNNLPANGWLRPLNVLRDLPPVADLIELCFSSTLDSDGRQYIEQMRRNGHDSSFLKWAPRMIESVSLPLSGFVWEHNGRVVGNVSMIPFYRGTQRIYLIANVATHPDFRRQGIARKLTQSALDRAREKHAHSIWLHVRDDNPDAIQLYKELGFIERARRTSWLAASDIPKLDSPESNIRLLSRSPREWNVQSGWLSRAYPVELDWYYAKTWQVFKPGIMNFIYRMLADIYTMQWSAYQDGKLVGVLSCQRSYDRIDHLWAALPAEPQAEMVTGIITYARQSLKHSRGFMMEYPAGLMDEAIRAAGLKAQRTLVWMEAPRGSNY